MVPKILLLGAGRCNDRTGRRYDWCLVWRGICGLLDGKTIGVAGAKLCHELEGVARALYCDTTGEPQPQEVGLILNHGVGYSPGSLVDANGLLEIKTKLRKF